MEDAWVTREERVGSQPFRALAQTVFFHHRGLLSSEAWRDLRAREPARTGQAPR